MYTYEYADDRIGDVIGEVIATERQIGHKIPRPYSQAMVEDLAVMPEFAKAQGQGAELMALAKRLYAEVRS